MLFVFKIALVLLSGRALAHPQLLGGNEVGNGGDVVVCRAGRVIKTVELLDFYERRMKSGNEILPQGTSEAEVLNGVFSRLRSIDEKRTALFEKRTSDFMKRTKFLNGVVLTDIPDSHHLMMPSEKGCKLEQIAIFEKGRDTFLINRELWNALSSVQKAGLILHELVYEHFSDLGEKNSIKVRAYNGFVFSSFDSKTYWEFIRSLRLPIYR